MLGMVVTLIVSVVLLSFGALQLGTSNNPASPSTTNPGSLVYQGVTAAELSVATTEATALFDAATAQSSLSALPVTIADLQDAAITLPTTGPGHIEISADPSGQARFHITTTSTMLDLCMTLPGSANAPAPAPTRC